MYRPSFNGDGILHWIGTQQGTAPYENPHTLGSSKAGDSNTAEGDGGGGDDGSGDSGIGVQGVVARMSSVMSAAWYAPSPTHNLMSAGRYAQYSLIHDSLFAFLYLFGKRVVHDALGYYTVQSLQIVRADVCTV